MFNTVQLADWSSRMSAALGVLEAADPEDNAAETLAVEVLAIEFKQSHIQRTFAIDAEEGSQPRVRSTDPNDGNIAIALDTDIVVTFSEAMDPATMIASNFLLSADGGAYTPVSSVSMDGTATIATLTVSGGLVADTIYKLRVLTSVLDADGNPLTYQFNQSTGFLTVA